VSFDEYEGLSPSFAENCRMADARRPGAHNQDSVSAVGSRPGAPRSTEQERPAMGDDAYHGLTGEVVHTIEPHTEADPVAILLQFLTLAGNVMGRTAYYQVEGDRHHTNLFAVLVGDSAKSRKGTSWGRVRAIGKVSDMTWADDRVKGGLSSGEGLINEVRDERKEWNKKVGREEVVDAGVKDKRLMVVEPEFASALAVAERHGNTLSALMRRAWDGDKLTTITKNTPLCATGAHISTVGHIPPTNCGRASPAPTWPTASPIASCSRWSSGRSCCRSAATWTTARSSASGTGCERRSRSPRASAASP
jgi:hypothetical protein